MMMMTVVYGYGLYQSVKDAKQRSFDEGSGQMLSNCI